MKVLVTAGQVYGRLDDNKLVGNRVRGIWACRFARWLSDFGVDVTLLVPDTMKRAIVELQLGESKPRPAPGDNEALRKIWSGRIRNGPGEIHIAKHNGFDRYRDRCWKYAETHDAAVLAAAVVNWIPAEPIKGKMDTKAYKAGDVIDIPFVLAESVIGRMREINPKLTLIGCKMTIGASEEELLDAAKGVIRASKANVIVANDQGKNLKRKLLVYPDGCVQEFVDDWGTFYYTLLEIITDKHWRTEFTPGDNAEIIQKGGLPMEKARKIFDTVADLYRDRFTARDGKTVHGAILVPVVGGGYLCTPRVKGPDFTSADAVWVAPEHSWVKEGERVIVVGRGAKASMNAPLMAWLARPTPDRGAHVVLHLHEMLEGVPTVPYAPPGTDRDNWRDLPKGAFNIEGHGFVARLNFDGTISKE